jgi:hypothetical protein
MPALHLIHGDTKYDKAELIQAAKRRGGVPTWIAPKNVRVGDDVVIYVGGAFFVTARVASKATQRPDWGPRRYGAALNSIKLISPPISRDVIRIHVSTLKWATFPRSISTVRQPTEARQLRKLIKDRIRGGASTITDKDLRVASLAEMRARALRDALPSTKRNRA